MADTRPKRFFPLKEDITLEDVKRAMCFFIPMMCVLDADMAYHICYHGGVTNPDDVRSVLTSSTGINVYKLAHFIEEAYGPYDTTQRDPFKCIVENLRLHKPADNSPQAIEAHRAYSKHVARMYDDFNMLRDELEHNSIFDKCKRMRQTTCLMKTVSPGTLAHIR